MKSLPWKPLVGTIGVLLDFVGALLLARELMVSEDQAIKLGASYWSDGDKDTQLKLPPVRERLRQSKIAKSGLSLFPRDS